MVMKSKSVLGQTHVVSVEKTRPANVTQYAAEDVISEDASSGTAWTFDAVVPTAGGGGYITHAIQLTDDTGVSYAATLYLFNATPNSNLNDNAANAAVDYANDASAYVGKIEFPAHGDLGGASESVATPSTDGNLPLAFECALGDDALYGILVINTATPTPTSGQKFTIKLFVEPS